MSLRRTVSLTHHRGHRLTTAPTVEPVTAAELLAHLRMDASEADDTSIAGYITDARLMIENRLGVAMVDQSWFLTMDRWPGGAEPWWDGVREGHRNMMRAGQHTVDVEMPRWPLSSITTVNVYDEDGTVTAVTVADTFDTDTNSIPGRLTLKAGATWPTALRANNAIEITYVAGYGTAASDVPADMRRAVLNLAAALYNTRGDGCGEKELIDKAGIDGVLGQYKIRRV